MPAASKNDVRLQIRLDRQAKELIERAACATGQSVNDFAASVLVENARRVLQEHGTTVLSDQDRNLFLALLDSDAKPNDALKRAVKKYRRLYG